MSNISINDLSSNHHYRTEVPNIIFELGLKANCIALYCAIKRAAGDNGQCTKSRKNLCKEAGIGLRNFPKIKAELCKKIKSIGKPLIKSEIRVSDAGDQDTDLVTVVDIWPENYAFFLNKRGGGAKLHVPPCKNARGGAKLHPGVEQNCMGGGAKLHDKEEPFKKNLYEEEQLTPHTPKCERVFFGSHVKLTKEEYESFCNNYGKIKFDDLIAEMNDYCLASKPSGYKDYAAAFRQWIRKRKQEVVKPAVDRRTQYQNGNPISSPADERF